VRVLPRSPVLWHALAVAVALWALSTLFRFRVLGWPFLAYLPWVGSALVLLHLLLLANRFIAPSSAEGTIQEVVRRLTFGARLVIIAFVYWAVFVAFNAGFDRRGGRGGWRADAECWRAGDLLLGEPAHRHGDR